MVTTDHHKKKPKKPKNRKTKKRETRYYTDDYSLPGSLNTRHENDWFACGWIYIGFVSFLFLFFVSGILSSERAFFFQ